MSHHPSSTSAAARGPAPGPDRTREVQMMVLGSVLALLGPLGGFLAGSMIGLTHRIGEFDAMFVAMFIGLLVGGLGGVVAGLGLLRYARREAEAGPTTTASPPDADRRP